MSEQPAGDKDAGAAPGSHFVLEGLQVRVFPEQAADLRDGNCATPATNGIARLVAGNGTGAGRVNRQPPNSRPLRNQRACDDRKQGNGQSNSDGRDGHDAEKGAGRHTVKPPRGSDRS